MLRQEKEDGLIVRDRKERLPLDGLGERGYGETANQTAYFRSVSLCSTSLCMWSFVLQLFYCLFSKAYESLKSCRFIYIVKKRQACQYHSLPEDI